MQLLIQQEHLELKDYFGSNFRVGPEGPEKFLSKSPVDGIPESLMNPIPEKAQLFVTKDEVNFPKSNAMGRCATIY